MNSPLENINIRRFKLRGFTPAAGVKSPEETVTKVATEKYTGKKLDFGKVGGKKTKKSRRSSKRKSKRKSKRVRLSRKKKQ